MISKYLSREPRKLVEARYDAFAAAYRRFARWNESRHALASHDCDGITSRLTMVLRGGNDPLGERNLRILRDRKIAAMRQYQAEDEVMSDALTRIAATLGK